MKNFFEVFDLKQFSTDKILICFISMHQFVFVSFFRTMEVADSKHQCPKTGLVRNAEKIEKKYLFFENSPNKKIFIFFLPYKKFYFFFKILL